MRNYNSDIMISLDKWISQLDYILDLLSIKRYIKNKRYVHVYFYSGGIIAI